MKHVALIAVVAMTATALAVPATNHAAQASIAEAEYIAMVEGAEGIAPMAAGHEAVGETNIASGGVASSPDVAAIEDTSGIAPMAAGHEKVKRGGLGYAVSNFSSESRVQRA